ncbi:hypothetical protein HY493_05215 [Candidatus Woesearchaeota archaeon]|nr:hypothetical protein [Candidatus Woesearchaeota archaeon]
MFTIHWNDCGFSAKQVRAVAKRLLFDVHQLHHVIQERMYGNDAASVILPFDKRHVAAAKVLAKKCGNADLVIVVGIGGSNLGTLAVQQAVTGIFDQRILYADTVDPDATHHIIDEAKRVLKSHGRVVLNAVSKSGSTTETIANFAALVDALPHSDHLHIIVTTDVGSHFEQFARSKGYDVLSIPTHVGGRYSVFSTVGLFPLAVLGVDVHRLVEGAHDALQRCLRKNNDNPALLLAAIAYLNHQKGKRVHDTFVFSKDLEGYGRWYRQLLAESIGKGAEAGIIPTVSVGSTDLHSVGQLDLAGPDLTYYRFVTVKKTQHDLHVPDGYDALVPLSGKSFSTIMDAILKGTQAAFKRHKRPFIEISLPDKSEETIGALLQTEMVSVMLLGHLLRVNPFDQPAVEEYKNVTRKLLG